MIALRGHLKQQDDKKWKWQGVWAFGALTDTVPKSVKNPANRPFNYTWIEPESAGNVLVPSLYTFGPDDEEEDEDIAAVRSTAASNVDTIQAGTAEASAIKASGPSLGTADENKLPDNKNDTDSPPDVNTQSPPASKTREQQDTSGPQPMQIDVIEQAPISTTVVKENENPIEEKLDDAAKNSKAMETAIIQTPETLATASSDQGENYRMSALKSKAVTFATTFDNEPQYTEGHTLHPDKIPPDGNWTGYFENASKRKDRHSSRVSEHFAIFFNTAPAKDARMLFLDDEDLEKEEENEGSVANMNNLPNTEATTDGNSLEKKDEVITTGTDAIPTLETTPKEASRPGLLPPGFVHVRGMGTNQFGTFELLGGLDLSTGLLECQRMYVVTPDNTKATTSRKKTTSTRHRIPNGTSRPYSTRKRQLTWQRRSTMSDDEAEMIGMKRFSTSKKRPRSVSDVAKSPAPAASPRPPALLIPVNPGTVKRPSPTASSIIAAGPKKRTSAPIMKAGTPPGGTKLPLVGDPNQARWRAAHFLYYQRHDPASDDNSAANSAAFSFVIYEGEMLNGACQRDGRGVCLFNNGTLYEGEWKRKKEHGKGTLMTADRRRIMYEGEWERGRMHGQGTYFYSGDASVQARRNRQVDSRYIGEFKENARHGVGKYYLPDGSTYEGEWRDNEMSGQGTFRWPDESFYVGQWKDGKRHGTGMLSSSDGFTYDGMWVQNAMEGRGIATYPSGQRYEGLWANGRREGRGTIVFTNGAIYEGRFRDDCMEGQGTMKMSQNVFVPTRATSDDDAATKDDWMIPISFQSDIGHIHQKAGFTVGGE